MNILYEVRPLFEIDHQIIDIALDFFMEHIVKNYLYCPLGCHSCNIKCEGHNLISRNAFWCVASCGLLIIGAI